MHDFILSDYHSGNVVGERLWPNPPQMVDTIAEGIRLQQLGHLPWLIALKLVEKDVFTVVSEPAFGDFQSKLCKPIIRVALKQKF